MLRLTDEAKAELRRRADLAEIIQADGFELHFQGAQWRGCCPFEKGSTNRSKFVVFGDGEGYKCWACPARGDVFTWFQEKHGMTWIEAVEKVAEIVGFDLAPYRGPARPESRAERLKRMAGEALAALAELSFQTARDLPPEERQVGGVDVTGLIESREIGLLPEPEVVEAYFDRLGIEKAVRREAGISQAGRQFARRWVFWAWRKNQVVAGRLYGRSGPIVGTAGSHSKGWTMPEKISSEGRELPALVAWDDRTYLELRTQGVENVFRPVSRESLDDARVLRGNDPVLVVRTERDARLDAWEGALSLLKSFPRLRVAEYLENGLESGLENSIEGVGHTTQPANSPEGGAGDIGEEGAAFGALEHEERVRRLVADLVEGAGTVLDWQLELGAETGVLEDASKGTVLAARLRKILEMVPENTMEHIVYGQIIEQFESHIAGTTQGSR